MREIVILFLLKVFYQRIYNNKPKQTKSIYLNIIKSRHLNTKSVLLKKYRGKCYKIFKGFIRHVKTPFTLVEASSILWL